MINLIMYLLINTAVMHRETELVVLHTCSWDGLGFLQQCFVNLKIGREQSLEEKGEEALNSE